MVLRINLQKIKIFLIFCVGFFLPFGGGLKELGKYPPIFCIFSVILLSLFLLQTGIKFPPFAAKVFIFYVIAHIILTIAILKSDYLFQALPTIGRQSFGTETNGTFILRLIFLIWLFLMIVSVIVSKKELLVLTTSFIVGLITTCFIKINVLFNFYNVRFTGGYDDPNAFGLAAGMAFFLALFAANQAKGLMKNLGFLLAVLCLGMVVATQSRGAWIALFIAFIWLAIRLNLRYLVPLVLLGVIVYLLHSFLPERLLVPVAWGDDGGAGRLTIWKIYLSNMDKYFITGLGFSRSSQVISTGIIGKELIPHNVSLEILVEFGFCGLILFVWMLRVFWKRIFLAHIELIDKGILSALFLFWVFSTFFLSSFMLRETWLFWAIMCNKELFNSSARLKEARV